LSLYEFMLIPLKPTLLWQSSADLAGHTASDGADIEAQLAVRCQEPIPLDNERRGPGVQPPIRVRSAGRRRHGHTIQTVAFSATALSLRGGRAYPATVSL